MRDIVQRRIVGDKRIFQVYDTHELCTKQKTGEIFQRTGEIFQRTETHSHRKLESVYIRIEPTISERRTATEHLKLERHCSCSDLLDNL